MSVRITEYKICINGKNKPFVALILQGGVEIVRSANGNLYATGKKASIATSFDEATARSLIGSEIPGQIVKEECEPYEYTMPETGEVLFLSHRYIYLEHEELIQQASPHVAKQVA